MELSHFAQYSEIVIDQMRRRHKETRPEMECKHSNQIYHLYHPRNTPIVGHVMDVRDLSFPSESFDVAIDKGIVLSRSSPSTWN